MNKYICITLIITLCWYWGQYCGIGHTSNRLEIVHISIWNLQQNYYTTLLLKCLTGNIVYIRKENIVFIYIIRYTTSHAIKAD